VSRAQLCRRLCWCQYLFFTWCTTREAWSDLETLMVSQHIVHNFSRSHLSPFSPWEACCSALQYMIKQQMFAKLMCRAMISVSIPSIPLLAQTPYLLCGWKCAATHVSIEFHCTSCLHECACQWLQTLNSMQCAIP
jgi:hypothetical protein